MLGHMLTWFRKSACSLRNCVSVIGEKDEPPAAGDFDYVTAQAAANAMKFQITGLGEVVSATCSQGGRLHSYGRRPRCAAEDAGA